MSKNTKENNWIDLSSLPKMGGEEGRVYWSKCYNMNVDFCFENIKGTLTIIKSISDKKCLISYNGKEIEVPKDTLRDCKLAYIVGAKTHNFKYQLEEIINTKEGQVKILRQYYKHKFKKYYDKTYEVKSKCYDIECQICHGIVNEYEEEKIGCLVNCPFCSGFRLLVGFNDMWTTHSEQAKLLKNPDDGYKYMYSANKPILEWVCPICGEIIKKTPNDVAEKGLCCPKCKNMTSYPNRFMYHFIKQLTDNVEREKIFDWSQSRRYDIYFDNNCICEAHGMQHYEKSGFTTRSLEEEQENDKQKHKLAFKNGIKEYIVIDCRYSDFDFIKNNVINSRFADLYDLTKIDWIKLENDINNNILIQASNLWNSGIHDPEMLARELDINQNNIHIIMSRAKELGLCDYDTAITQAIGREKMNKIKYHKYAKPILCNENGDCYGNVTLCVSALKEQGIITSNGNIQRNIKTNKFPIYGLTFQYISHKQFNNIKSQFPNKAYGDFFNLLLDETVK